MIYIHVTVAQILKTYLNNPKTKCGIEWDIIFYYLII